MTASDIIQITSIIISAILTIVSLWIAIKSLKQSQISIELAEKTIEETNRPYVVVYRDYIQVLSTVHEYIVIKNFGSTGAIIDSLNIQPEYNYNNSGNKKVFTNIKNTFIAPNQSISTVTYNNVFENNRTDLTKINIKYHSATKAYFETFTLNEDLKKDIKFAKPIPSSKTTVEEILSRATEEIIRINL